MIRFSARGVIRKQVTQAVSNQPNLLPWSLNTGFLASEETDSRPTPDPEGPSSCDTVVDHASRRQARRSPTRVLSRACAHKTSDNPELLRHFRTSSAAAEIEPRGLTRIATVVNCAGLRNASSLIASKPLPDIPPRGTCSGPLAGGIPSNAVYSNSCPCGETHRGVGPSANARLAESHAARRVACTLSPHQASITRQRIKINRRRARNVADDGGRKGNPKGSQNTRGAPRRRECSTEKASPC